MPLPSAAKTYRWYQFRLWFLVTVIPLGGSALCLPRAEVEQLKHDAEFRRQLERWQPGELGPEKEDAFITQIVARKVSIVDLPHRLLQQSQTDGNLLFVSLRKTAPRLPISHLFCLSENRRIIGAIALHRKWQTGQVRKISPEVMLARDYLVGLSPDSTHDTVNQLLEERRIGITIPRRAGRAPPLGNSGRRIQIRSYVRKLGSDFNLIVFGRYSSKNPLTFAYPPPDICPHSRYFSAGHRRGRLPGQSHHPAPVAGGRCFSRRCPGQF